MRGRGRGAGKAHSSVLLYPSQRLTPSGRWRPRGASVRKQGRLWECDRFLAYSRHRLLAFRNLESCSCHHFYPSSNLKLSSWSSLGQAKNTVQTDIAGLEGEGGIHFRKGDEPRPIKCSDAEQRHGSSKAVSGGYV